MLPISKLVGLPTVLLVAARNNDAPPLEIHESHTRSFHLLSATKEMLRHNVPADFILNLLESVDDLSRLIPTENHYHWLEVKTDPKVADFGWLLHVAEQLVKLYRQGESSAFHQQMFGFEKAIQQLTVRESEPNQQSENLGNYSFRVKRWKDRKDAPASDYEQRAESPQIPDRYLGKMPYEPGTKGLEDYKQKLATDFDFLRSEIDVLKHTLDRINPNWLNKTDEYYSGVKVSLPIRAALLYIEAAENYFGTGGKAVEPSLIFNPSIPFASWNYAEPNAPNFKAGEQKASSCKIDDVSPLGDNVQEDLQGATERYKQNANPSVLDPTQHLPKSSLFVSEQSNLFLPNSTALTPFGEVYFAARQAADQYARTGCSPEAFRAAMENLAKAVFAFDVPAEQPVVYEKSVFEQREIVDTPKTLSAAGGRR